MLTCQRAEQPLPAHGAGAGAPRGGVRHRRGARDAALVLVAPRELQLQAPVVLVLCFVLTLIHKITRGEAFPLPLRNHGRATRKKIAAAATAEGHSAAVTSSGSRWARSGGVRFGEARRSTRAASFRESRRGGCPCHPAS